MCQALFWSLGDTAVNRREQTKSWCFCAPGSGLGYRLCQVPCGHMAIGPDFFLCSQKGEPGLCLLHVGRGALEARGIWIPLEQVLELLGLLVQERMRGKWFLQGGSHSLLGPRSAQAWPCLADLLLSTWRPYLYQIRLSCTLAWAVSLMMLFEKSLRVFPLLTPDHRP